MKIIQITTGVAKKVTGDKVQTSDIEIYGLGDDGVLYYLNKVNPYDANPNKEKKHKWVVFVQSTDI